MEPDSGQAQGQQARAEHRWRHPTEAREADARAFEAMERERKVNLKAFLFSVAVILAPFFALLFGVDAALFVLVLAMAFVTWLTWAGSNHVAAAQRSRLRAAAIFNGVLGLVILGLLLLRVFA